ncbi:MAG TPA: hypothetical protein VGX76_01415 [Pirellulales bacterium]|jgi:hypothetical protein|nr:hypothetical protein [Pirellulales bacterium]
MEVLVQCLFGIAVAAAFTWVMQTLVICTWRRDPAFMRFLESPTFRTAKVLAVIVLGTALALSQSHRSLALGRNFDVLVDVIREMLPRCLQP